ncbi:MAG TPA: hypothetical protein PKK12_09040, partial [Candidatus Aminicenantes bacterium]|nr:hypothetical protein [Candidatus Aminicenantes bacterium]
AEGTGEAMPVSSAPPFPIKLDGSAEHQFRETGEAELSRDLNHTENLRLEDHQQLGTVALDLRSRATCSNQLVPERTRADLPDLMVSLTTGAHALRLGDIAPVESELTIGGAGRRGLEYLFDNQRLYFHLFTGSTQQLSGFKGFGIPKASAGIFGGAAGFTLFQRFGLKAIFVTGQDDPTLAVNTGSIASLSQPRKGNVLAVTGRTTLWQDRLSLTMEYAQSRFDPDTTDGSGEVKDAALQISSSLRLGILDLQAGYRDIGRNFQPIAQSIFVNDRRGANAAAGITLGKFRWSGSLALEKTNTDDDPTLIAAKDLRRQVDFSWQFGSMSSFRLGYSASRQDARLNDDPVMQGNMNQEGLTAGLGLGLSRTLQLNLDARFDRLKNADDPSLEGDSLSLNLGLLWQSPERFLWSSALGLTQTKNKASGERGKLITVSCTGNVTLVARLLSLNATGAYFRNDLAGPNDSDTLGVDGGISLNLRRLVHIGDVIVSLRGGLNSATTAGQKVHSSRLFLRGDVSL